MMIERKNLKALGEATTEMLREARKRAFRAFDIYKTNISYGIISETKAKHTEILNWYNACCDLDKEAINNVPSEIKEYM